MVDVSSKSPTSREAKASGVISLSSAAFSLLADTHTLQQDSVQPQRSLKKAAKGDVLGVARVAGIMAAKHTPSLIPLCHTIPLTHVAVDFDLCAETSRVRVCASVRL